MVKTTFIYMKDNQILTRKTSPDGERGDRNPAGDNRGSGEFLVTGNRYHSCRGSAIGRRQQL